MASPLSTSRQRELARRTARALRQRLEETLTVLLPPGTRAVYLNVPIHINRGDHLIALGAFAALKRIGTQLTYTSGKDGFNEARMRAVLGADTVIVMHGGGNFGDLYPEHQEFRERIVRSFPDHRIVMLPQSIWYRSADERERTAALYAEHSRLTLMARDRRSFEDMKSHFENPVVLCPDTAFGISLPFLPARPASAGVVWLLRRDEEAVPIERPVTANGIDRRWRTSASNPVYRTLRHLARVWERPQSARCAATLALSAYQVLGGLRLITSGRLVVSDRLHVQILSLLSGRPHLALDNNYGKLGDYMSTWYPDELTDAVFVRDAAQLESLIDARLETLS